MNRTLSEAPGEDWNDWNTGQPPEVSEEDWSNAAPVCPRCLEEVSELDHYCSKCRFAVGPFAPNIPFVNIPFLCEPFAIMWERLWFPQGESIPRRTLYAALLIMAGMITGYIWIMLIALAWWWMKPPAQIGHCEKCGYDLRASEGRCPECGHSEP